MFLDKNEIDETLRYDFSLANSRLILMRPKSESATKEPVKLPYRPLSVRDRQRTARNNVSAHCELDISKKPNWSITRSRETPSSVWAQMQIARRPPSGPLFPYTEISSPGPLLSQHTFARNHSGDYQEPVKTQRKRYYGPSRVTNQYISSPGAFFHVQLSVPVTSCEPICLNFLLSFLGLGYLFAICTVFTGSTEANLQRSTSFKAKLRKLAQKIRQHRISHSDEIPSTDHELLQLSESEGISPHVQDVGYSGDDDTNSDESKQSTLKPFVPFEAFKPTVADAGNFGQLNQTISHQLTNFERKKITGSYFTQISTFVGSHMKSYPMGTEDSILGQLRRTVVSVAKNNSSWVSAKTYLTTNRSRNTWIIWDSAPLCLSKDNNQVTSFCRTYTKRMRSSYIKQSPPDEVYYADTEKFHVSQPAMFSESDEISIEPPISEIFASETTIVAQTTDSEPKGVDTSMEMAGSFERDSDPSFEFGIALAEPVTIAPVSERTGSFSIVPTNLQPENQLPSEKADLGQDFDDFDFNPSYEHHDTQSNSAPRMAARSSLRADLDANSGFRLRPFKIGSQGSKENMPSFTEKTSQDDEVVEANQPASKRVTSTFVEIIENSPVENREKLQVEKMEIDKPTAPKINSLTLRRSNTLGVSPEREGKCRSIYSSYFSFFGRKGSRIRECENGVVTRQTSRRKLSQIFKKDSYRETVSHGTRIKRQRSELCKRSTDAPLFAEISRDLIRQERKQQRLVRKEIREYFKPVSLDSIDLPTEPLFHRSVTS